MIARYVPSALVLVGACSAAAGPATPPPPPAGALAVVISPSHPTALLPGTSRAFTAAISDTGTGIVVTGKTITWAVTPAGIVSLAGSTLSVPLGQGLGYTTVTLSATVDSGSGSIAVPIRDWASFSSSDPASGDTFHGVSTTDAGIDVNPVTLYARCTTPTNALDVFVFVGTGLSPVNGVTYRFSGDTAGVAGNWTEDQAVTTLFYPGDAGALMQEMAVRDTLYFRYNRAGPVATNISIPLTGFSAYLAAIQARCP